MLSIQNAPYIIGSYAVTLGGIALYTWHILAQARRAARQVRREDRPWS